MHALCLPLRRLFPWLPFALCCVAHGSARLLLRCSLLRCSWLRNAFAACPLLVASQCFCCVPVARGSAWLFTALLVARGSAWFRCRCTGLRRAARGSTCRRTLRRVIGRLLVLVACLLVPSVAGSAESPCLLSAHGPHCFPRRYSSLGIAGRRYRGSAPLAMGLVTVCPPDTWLHAVNSTLGSTSGIRMRLSKNRRMFCLLTGSHDFARPYSSLSIAARRCSWLRMPAVTRGSASRRCSWLRTPARARGSALDPWEALRPCRLTRGCTWSISDPTSHICHLHAAHGWR